jgi:tetratricopeptide (TPR) repeat protein
MRLELDHQGARVDGRCVALTQVERSLLAWLLAHAGQPQSRETLLQHVWGYSPRNRLAAASRTVDTAVRRLRTKLEVDPARPAIIRTVHGQGYVLDVAPDAPLFVGRSAERAELGAWLQGDGPLMIVTGPPGVGKSALVAEVLADRAPRVDLSDADLSSALALLEHHRELVWLDDADGVLPELAGVLAAHGRRAVVTCRYAVDHPAASLLPLQPLPEPDARVLLRTWLRQRFAAAEHTGGELDRILEEGRGNPVRLRLALWTRQGGAPPTLARHASEEALLRYGVARLPPALARAWRRLLAVPLPLDEEAAERLLGGRELLMGLRDRWLVEEEPGWRPLLRDPPDRADEAQAVQALGPWLVQWASLPHARTEGVLARQALLSWLAPRLADPAEAALLAIVVDRACGRAGGGHDSRALLDAALARPLPPEVRVELLERRVSARQRVRALTPEGLSDLDEAEALARTLGTSQLLSTQSRRMLLALAQARLGEALRHGEGVVQTAVAAEDAVQEALGHIGLSQVLGLMGRHPRALHHARAAVALAPDDPATWQLHLQHGRALLEMGRDREARAVLEALAPPEEVPRIWVRAALAWVDLVSGALPAAQPREALYACYLELLERGDRRAPSVGLTLAAAEILAGSPERALPLLSSLRPRIEADEPFMRSHLAAGLAAAWLALGLQPRALPEPVEGVDPLVLALTDGLLAAARGERAAAEAALAQTAEATGSAVRTFRRSLLRALEG